jgi:tripartite ATP-independent transporter DctP family solute receptor
MKKMKSVTLLIIALMMLVVLSACGSDSTAEGKETDKDAKVKTTTLKMAFNQPDTHPQYQAMEDLSKKFYDATDGAYKIELYPNELLGAQRETVEFVQTGTIAMSIVAGGLLENLNEDFVVFNLPYVFDSAEHQMSVINNPDVVKELYTSLEDDGIHVLGAFHAGSRNVYNNEKPIETPEDLKGMKIRIIESDTNVQMMKMMGGVGTPMGQGEVYTAIQSGVLEGGENNELIYSNLKHSEIAPYFSYTQHLLFPDYLIINNDILSNMSDEHKEILQKEMVEAIDLEVKLWDEEVAKAIEVAEEGGAKFNTPDIKLFQDAVKPLVEEKLTSDTKKALYEKVRDAAK